MRKEILLESNPDLSCNTYELYRYFLKEGLNKKYRLVWRVREPGKYRDNEPENVFYIRKYPSGVIDIVKNYIRCNRALVSISCNMNLPKYRVSKKQINIYLDHGSQLKSMRTKDGQKAPLSCGYLTIQSRFFEPYNLQEYTVRKDQIVCTGLPRDDAFYRENGSLERLVPDAEEFDKVIIWTPTFRAHKNGYRVDCDTSYPFGLPFLYTIEDVGTLVTCLEKTNTLLLVKPHPAQDLSSLKLGPDRNLRVITSEKLADEGIQINELLAQTDAMLTDYSSIYYDYLFTGNPIALTLDDFARYRDEKGLVFEDPLKVLKGELLYTIEDLCEFIRRCSSGIDTCAEERKKLQAAINDFDDGENAKRVYDFLISKLQEARR